MTAWLDIIGFGEGDPLPALPHGRTIIGPTRAIERLSRAPLPLEGRGGGGGRPHALNLNPGAPSNSTQ